MGLGWSRFSTLLEFCLDNESSESCEPIIIEALFASSNVIELYPRSDIPPATFNLHMRNTWFLRTMNNKKQTTVSNVFDVHLVLKVVSAFSWALLYLKIEISNDIWLTHAGFLLHVR